MKHHTAVYDGALERDFCETVIRLFEDEQHKIESARYALARGDLSDTTVAVIDEDIARARRGRVVVCDNAPELGRAKEEFTRSAERFMQIFATEHPGVASLREKDYDLTVPRVERIDEAGGFDWHMDSRRVREDCFLSKHDRPWWGDRVLLYR
jgi:hypothetical protein